MKAGITFLFLFVAILFCNGQYAFHKRWDKRFGGIHNDGLLSITQTSDKGFFVGGGSKSNIGGDKTEDCRGNSDYWVVKTDSVGNKQWDKRFGGIGEESLSEVIACNSGYFLSGTMGSGANGDISEPGRGGDDYWVIRLDGAGNKLWDKRFGGNGTELLTSAAITKDGGYILAGYSYSSASGDKTQTNWDPVNFSADAWIVKIDSNGNKQWDKRFGGTRQDGAQDILQTSDGGYLLGCYTASDSSGDKTQPWWGYQVSAYWIVKTDSAGNKQWDKRYGGLGGGDFSCFSQTNDGGYILGGNSSSDSSGDKTQNRWGVYGDYWIVKIDFNGNMQWDKDFGGLDDDFLDRVFQTKDNGYLVSGWSSFVFGRGGDKTEDNLGGYQTWLIKIDSVGKKEWDKTIFTVGGDNGGYSLQTDDGCYVVANTSNSEIGGYKTEIAWDSSYDYWLIKFCMEPFTGINEQPAGTAQLQVYPNPFTSDISIFIQKQNLHAAIFTITNAVGQTIYQRQENNLASNYTKMLDLSYLHNGLYFISLEIDGERTVKQVVKQ